MDLPKDSVGHDLITIGGSLGSFEVIRDLLRALPVDLPAAVLITTHLGPTVSLLNIVEKYSVLPIKSAESGEPLLRAHVYVAVPDAHLLVHDHHILVRRGPRENLSRPAIDPMFRSAACAFGTRVIGVLLSGGLNDGAAGLAAIQTCGGLTVVQDPQDAAVPSMPRSAMNALAVDHCVPASKLPSLLSELVQVPAGATPDIPSSLKLEVAIAAQEASGMEVNEKLGEKSTFTCSECDGALWEIEDDRVLRFRCHVGHAVTADALLEQRREAVDSILNRLLRTHEERAALARKMSRVAETKRTATAPDLKRRAMGYEEDAAVVRGLLENLEGDRPRRYSSEEL